MKKKVKKWLGLSMFSFLMIGVLGSFLLLSSSTAKAATSGDAYTSYDSGSKTWTMGTGKVEKKVQLNSQGQFLLTSFKNKITGHDYIQGGQISEEFAVTINGTSFTGASTGWVYDSYLESMLSQGEIQLSIIFHNGVVQVTRYYIIYPSTGVIQEWSVFKNISGSTESFTDMSIFNQRIMSNDISNLDFHYMTGGGNFRGSLMLKTVNLTTSYTRAFDSYDSPELSTVDGIIRDWTNDNKQGSSIWNEFYAIRNSSLSEGVFLTFDYMGHWGSNVGNYSGNVLLKGAAKIVNLAVEANNTITSPKSMTGVFSGDLDDMGNTINDYIYKYKWDYTRDNYFGKSEAYQWIQGNQMKNAFNMINNARYVGSDIIHIDDNWYDIKGDWNNRTDGDFSAVNTYLKKYGMNMMVWMPPWQVGAGSSVLTNNPSWQVGQDTSGFYGWHLNMANSSVITWISNLLNTKQTNWGSYSWRYDGNITWPSNGSDNDMLMQSSNWYDLLKAFKDNNPNAGINGCSSGGEAISIESVRYSDSQQVTDGESGHFTRYWTSLIVPLSKMGNSQQTWGTRYNEENSGIVTAVNMADAAGSMLTYDKETIRKDVELFHYLNSKGVIGRYVKVYRPAVSSGDKTFLLQSMSSDSTKGIISFEQGNPFVGQNITVYPKGLTAGSNYTISTLKGSRSSSTQTGSYWMTNGISLTPYKSGDTILFNLTDRPGAGTDTVAPTSPTNVSMKLGTYMSSNGIELDWTAGTDDRWVSYYEIFRNGVSVDKVSKGMFYFDKNGSYSDVYQVRTVDGDGNVSSQTTAIAVGPGPTPPPSPSSWTASSGFSSTQGQNQWYYQQWNGSSYSNMTWDTTNNRWMGSQAFALIGGNWQHADTSYDSVRKWVAPSSGTITVTGNPKKGIVGGDGVTVMILKNNAPIWGRYTIGGNDMIGLTHEVTTNVNAGDAIYFRIGMNGDNQYDSTSWNPTIYYGKPSPPPQSLASSGFSSTQGQNQWYYQQWNGSSYSNMTWDATNNRWMGSQAYALIGDNWQHPDTSYDSVRKWVSNKEGEITIIGNAKMNSIGGDGVIVKIMKNSNVIWGPQSISGSDTVTGVNQNIVTDIMAGDTIYFIVNKNGTNSYDSTNWDPTIAYRETLPVKATEGFSNTQGNNNWLYQQWNGTTNPGLSWDNINNLWYGTDSDLKISSNWQIPGTNYDAARVWIAPKAGHITISGGPHKFTADGGDGVNVRIVQNRTVIWGPKTVPWNEISNTGVVHDVTVDVSKGDAIYFLVNMNSNTAYDVIDWEPAIYYDK